MIRSNQRGNANGRQRQAAMLVLIIVLLVGFLIAVALTIDTAQMHLSRTQLRTATDAAAKAAAETLSRQQDIDAAVQRGIEIAALNEVSGRPLTLTSADFQFGRSIANGDGRFEFSASSRPFNSVRVLGDKSIGSSSGAVPLFFGNALGVDFFEPLNSATATYLDRDVVLVVDRSGSMRDDNKSVDLQSAITLFLDILDDSSPIERVGLASYNETSTRDVSLTTDSVSIRSAMGALEFDGRTSISRGLEDGGQIFLNDTARPFAERTIIVMTDGRHNEGPEPSIPAAEIANENIRIHTITFGENADRARMEQVAAIGGGRSYHAEDGDQLRDVYREIALTLSTIITE